MIIGVQLDFTKVIYLDSEILKNLITGGLSMVINPLAEYLDFRASKSRLRIVLQQTLKNKKPGSLKRIEKARFSVLGLCL